MATDREPGTSIGTGRTTDPDIQSEDGHRPVPTTDAQWRELLSPSEYRVLRQAGTEAPFTGEYVNTRTQGVYRCRACGAKLFTSDSKFESHCGWPSFFDAVPDTVRLLADNSLGMRRTEVRCARCDSHLGHLFVGEGYDTPTDQRYCINSISMTMEPAEAGH
jgi:peptide-methionine (R)-S-oxide reductase